MRIKDKTVVLEQADLILEYFTFDESSLSHLVLAESSSCILTACGLQFLDEEPEPEQSKSVARCPRCVKSTFAKMKRID